MMVIGFGSDGRKYVIDFIRDKMKFSEKTKAILELAERWRPSVIFWEENASVEGGEHIAEVLEKRGWAGLEFFAFRQPTSISKEDWIGKLEPDFRAGNIIFPYDRWYKGYDGMERDLVQDFLNDEYLVMTRMRRRKRSFRREIHLHRRCQVARRATRGALRSKVARGCAAQTAKQSSARAAKRRSGRKEPRGSTWA